VTTSVSRIALSELLHTSHDGEGGIGKRSSPGIRQI
jgi:hypothetical protein